MASLKTRNEKITAELEELSIQCEELEDKVAMISEERNTQKVRIDNQLRK